VSIILEHVTVTYGRGAKRFDAARNVNLAILGRRPHIQ
jgi:hypothetical protein